jgi:hypothetical protein
LGSLDIMLEEVDDVDDVESDDSSHDEWWIFSISSKSVNRLYLNSKFWSGLYMI